MSVGSPNRGWSATDWLAAVLALALAGIHLYVGVTYDEPQFFIVAALFVLGVALFFTDYWRDVTYLLAVVYVLVLGVLWVLGGMEYRRLGLLTGAISAAFVGVVIYLFARDAERWS